MNDLDHELRNGLLDSLSDAYNPALCRPLLFFLFHPFCSRRGPNSVSDYKYVPGFIRVEPGEGKGEEGRGEEWFEWEILLSRYGTVRHGTARYGTVRYGTARHGTVRHGTVRYSTIRIALFLRVNLVEFWSLRLWLRRCLFLWMMLLRLRLLLLLLVLLLVLFFAIAIAASVHVVCCCSCCCCCCFSCCCWCHLRCSCNCCCLCAPLLVSLMLLLSCVVGVDAAIASRTEDVRSRRTRPTFFHTSGGCRKQVDRNVHRPSYRQNLGASFHIRSSPPETA